MSGATFVVKSDAEQRLDEKQQAGIIALNTRETEALATIGNPATPDGRVGEALSAIDTARSNAVNEVNPKVQAAEDAKTGAETARDAAQAARTQAEAQATAAANSALQAAVGANTYETAAQRDAAIPTPAAGQVSYVKNGNGIYEGFSWNGSAWIATGGEIPDAPVTTLSNARGGREAEYHPWAVDANISTAAYPTGPILGSDTRFDLLKNLNAAIVDFKVYGASVATDLFLERIRIGMVGGGINSHFITIANSSGDGGIVAQFRQEATILPSEYGAVVKLFLEEANGSGISAHIWLRPHLLTQNSVNTNIQYKIAKTCYAREDQPTTRSYARPLGTHYDNSKLVAIGGNSGSNTLLDIYAKASGGYHLKFELRRFVDAANVFDCWCFDRISEVLRVGQRSFEGISENEIVAGDSSWTCAMQRSPVWAGAIGEHIGEQAHKFESHSYGTGVPALNGVRWFVDGKLTAISAALRAEFTEVRALLRTYLVNPDNPNQALARRDRVVIIRRRAEGGLWIRVEQQVEMLQNVAVGQWYLAMFPVKRFVIADEVSEDDTSRQITHTASLDGSQMRVNADVSNQTLTDPPVRVPQFGVRSFEIWGDEVWARMKVEYPYDGVDADWTRPNQAKGFINLERYRSNKMYATHTAGKTLSAGEIIRCNVTYEIDSARAIGA